MGSWIFDMVLVSIAVLVMAYVFFKLVFSSSEAERREMAGRPKPRFERREAERTERRRENLGSPQGAERRVGPRR